MQDTDRFLRTGATPATDLALRTEANWICADRGDKLQTLGHNARRHVISLTRTTLANTAAHEDPERYGYQVYLV